MFRWCPWQILSIGDFVKALFIYYHGKINGVCDIKYLFYCRKCKAGKAPSTKEKNNYSLVIDIDIVWNSIKNWIQLMIDQTIIDVRATINWTKRFKVDRQWAPSCSSFATFVVVTCSLRKCTRTSRWKKKFFLGATLSCSKPTSTLSRMSIQYIYRSREKFKGFH